MSRCGRLRLHVADTQIRRIWCEAPQINSVLQERVIGLVPERLVLRARLSHRLDLRWWTRSAPGSTPCTAESATPERAVRHDAPEH
jgi:hypothetical protein